MRRVFERDDEIDGVFDAAGPGEQAVVRDDHGRCVRRVAHGVANRARGVARLPWHKRDRLSGETPQLVAEQERQLAMVNRVTFYVRVMRVNRRVLALTLPYDNRVNLYPPYLHHF